MDVDVMAGLEGLCFRATVREPDGMLCGAMFDKEERCRFALTRVWDGDLSKKTALFVMLNPSTADEKVDDPTIRRCVGFARREGCGGLMVVNLSAWRATKPSEMLAQVAAGNDQQDKNTAVIQWAWSRLLHWDSDRVLDQLTGDAAGDSPVIMAWGATSNDLLDKRKRMILRRFWVERRVKCLGQTSKGEPRHPLMVRADQPLEPYTRL